MISLEDSYRYCELVARKRAKNFYYAFLALPREKRRAMCALYAFMRECDDLSDETGANHEKLEGWRRQLDAALEGKAGEHAVWPAFIHIVETYKIPGRYFHEMIDGVSSDLEPRVIRTFDELHRYCYLVASVVGLTTIHIFGFDDPRAIPFAEKCGVALQLTNIIRDVKEDAGMGRVYLPEEDLIQFGVDHAQLAGDQLTPALRRLLAYQASRAREYYQAGRPLIGMIHKDSRGALWSLLEIYAQLLRRIEESGFDVMRRRIALSTFDKLAILARGMSGLT